MRKTLREYCQENQLSHVLSQWHPTRNKPLTPEGVSYGSNRRIWWQCEQGHQWQAAVYSRTGRFSGCPYCTGRRPLAGKNDLASRGPELLSQWHPEKNGDLSPDQVMARSHRKVWWLCPEGHEWQAEVKSRMEGCGCPICTRREIRSGENDLASTHPKLADQWHPIKNGTLRPQCVAAGSRKKVWWLCPRGHEWRAVVTSRASQGSGCPVCAGKMVLSGENDLASAFPHLAVQWHPENNAPLAPDQVTPFSNRKVWWRCPLGHDYQAVISARTGRGGGCPYCAGRRVLPGFNDLATLEPELSRQWHPELNGSITPESITAGSSKRVWWQCPLGHSWKTTVAARTGKQRTGCPVCAGRKNVRRNERYAAITAENRIEHGVSRI